MVKEFNIKSVTDAGVSEMQRALDQGLAMTFTRIVTGNGTYEEDEDVSGRTALKNQKNSYSFSGREDEVDGITLKAVLTNYDGSQSLVSTSYFINEIGIYISVDGTETLYAIAAVGDGNGQDMPAYNGRNVTQIKQDWFVACSNSANIEVTMTGGFALAEDLEAHENAELTDSDGVHGARVVADGDDYKVQAKIGGNWTDVTGGAKGGSRITVYTEEETLIGKNAVLKKGSTTIATKTIAANGTAVFEGVTEIGTLSVYASDGNESTTEDIEVPYYGVYDVELLLGTVHAINITTAETTLYGKTVTLTNGVDTKTGTLSAEGKATVKIKFTGSVTITSTDGAKTATKIITVSSGTTEYTVSLSFIPNKTFATATDEEIRQMVEAADNGDIDLYDDCGWRVGQEHVTTLGAIATSGTYDGVSWTVGEAQSEQQITLVLMHKGLYDLVTPVKAKGGGNRSKCSFVVGLKNSLGTYGYMNDSNTNSGSWNGSKRRNWCNGGFRGAMPADLRAVFKQFVTITAQTYNGSTNQNSNDYFALPAGKEVFGADGNQGGGYSNATEGGALTQFTWYETSSNRIKKQGDNGSAYNWWERSPIYNYANDFCLVSSNGGAGNTSASYAYGLSPFGCL